jgi:hypothetical protein
MTSNTSQRWASRSTRSSKGRGRSPGPATAPEHRRSDPMRVAVSTDLEALSGAEPAFELSELGDEQVWLDDDLARGSLQFPDRVDTRGYPVVYVGTVATAGDDTLRLRLLRSWTSDRGRSARWHGAPARPPRHPTGDRRRTRTRRLNSSASPARRTVVTRTEPARPSSLVQQRPLLPSRPRGARADLGAEERTRSRPSTTPPDSIETA